LVGDEYDGHFYLFSSTSATTRHYGHIEVLGTIIWHDFRLHWLGIGRQFRNHGSLFKRDERVQLKEQISHLATQVAISNHLCQLEAKAQAQHAEIQELKAEIARNAKGIPSPTIREGVSK
jgi:hypothetical protein